MDAQNGTRRLMALLVSVAVSLTASGVFATSSASAGELASGSASVPSALPADVADWADLSYEELLARGATKQVTSQGAVALADAPNCRLPENVTNPQCVAPVVGGCIGDINYEAGRLGQPLGLEYVAYIRAFTAGACSIDLRQLLAATDAFIAVVPAGKAYLGAAGNPSNFTHCDRSMFCSSSSVSDLSILPVQCWQLFGYLQGFDAPLPYNSKVLSLNRQATVCA